MLVGYYFCTYVSYLLGFDIDNKVSFGKKIFFPSKWVVLQSFRSKIIIEILKLMNYILSCYQYLNEYPIGDSLLFL